MSGFQILYLVFGLFIITAGLTMIITYTMTNPWWRNLLGRMMITYAAAEVLMSLILLLAIVIQLSPSWFRWAWFTLQVIVGCTFWFQTVTIVQLHLRRRRERT